MTDKEDLIFIEHILENIEDINSFVKGVSKSDFGNNKEKLNAVTKSIEIIGEAAKNLSKSFKENHLGISWNKIIGTRDILIHRYFGIDLDMLWEIIKKDLPELKKKVQKIKEELSD